MDTKLKEIFYNVANEAGYGTPAKLYKEAKRRGVDVSLKEVKDWLKSQEAYTLHKPRRVTFTRRRTVVKGINDLFQADLADVTNLAQHNDAFKFLLVVIDCFTKFARVIPIKNKKAQTILSALRTIFESVQPKNFQTDNGKEFVNNLVYEYCRSKDINIYTTRNRETKASMAERFIRTLKSKLYKFLTGKNTKRYIDELQSVVDAYNNTKNRYGFRPVDVNEDNEDEVRRKLFATRNVTIVYKFPIGDIVRISYERLPFQRGYNQLWSREVFTVHDQLPFDPPVYKLADAKGEVILGTFYTQELQSVNVNNDIYKIEQILNKRKTKKGIEYLVKWLGYPKSMNSWVREEDLSPV